MRDIPPSYWTKKIKKKRIEPRKKNLSKKRLQERLWELCKKIIRKKYKNICFTCGKLGLESMNWHTGHFLPASTCGNFIKYDLRNLRPQCYNCNINLGGNGAIYYQRLVETQGQAYVDQLFEDKKKIIKADNFFYLDLIDKYTEIYTALIAVDNSLVKK